MNYMAPVAEMIEMSMPSVLMISDASVGGTTPTGSLPGGGGGGGPIIP